MELGMNGNDDFFGGPVAPTSPSTGASSNPHMVHNKEYGTFAGPSATSSKSRSLIPVIVGAVVLGLLILSFFGYRMYFSHTQIELPDQLMGLERVDPDSPAGQSIEESWSGLKTMAGEEVELHIGAYNAGQKTLVVVAGETGTSDSNDVSEFFNGMSESMKAQLPSATLKDADAGDAGGTMKCFDVSQSGVKAGGCAWVGDDTFGMVIGAPLEEDVAAMARDVRSEIEK
jgi:hypothetical protein